ncbi:MAG: DUF3090 family protein [Acidimicrobiia bacterium]|nr:DUF3090 family protein [Acidimicrobiia bacterium]MXY74448.1 DUF3090 family protein [Acidimicrobiia bacterium]MYA38111.1 DUF3090 family protein [Acidimicrobiia bacterium]MYB79798.1 DUF3090 family protein [Acidimicrobiia bacterium]MYG92342.1 DUF3090 family protein [Acidimicrobiia bacterium]
MAMNNLGPAEWFVVGAIGPPGKRRFYFQVVADGNRHSLLAEKQQVEALASQGWRSLQRSGVEVDATAVESILSSDLEIDDPAGGEDFRVGTINVGIRPSGLMNISFESDRDEQGLMFMVSPEQFRAMALLARRLVRAGRPICPWCRLPKNPDGHECPARN